MAILEPQIYVVVEQFGAKNNSLLSGGLVHNCCAKSVTSNGISVNKTTTKTDLNKSERLRICYYFSPYSSSTLLALSEPYASINALRAPIQYIGTTNKTIVNILRTGTVKYILLKVREHLLPKESISNSIFGIIQLVETNVTFAFSRLSKEMQFQEKYKFVYLANRSSSSTESSCSTFVLSFDERMFSSPNSKVFTPRMIRKFWIKNHRRLEKSFYQLSTTSVSSIFLWAEALSKMKYTC